MRDRSRASTRRSRTRASRTRRACPHNQRLEFLGDAVLGLCVSELLAARFPDADEGTLTRMRSALVNANALARLGAKKIDLGAVARARSRRAHVGRARGAQRARRRGRGARRRRLRRARPRRRAQARARDRRRSARGARHELDSRSTRRARCKSACKRAASPRPRIASSRAKGPPHDPHVRRRGARRRARARARRRREQEGRGARGGDGGARVAKAPEAISGSRRARWRRGVCAGR